MRISVVMATWQGRRYLPGQLASIRGQTRAPDEVVIVDDASDDGTVEIIKDFAASTDSDVRLLRQEERQGSTAAFQRGISAATGDIIALADQDDLWFPQKLSRIRSVFDQSPQTTFVFSDASLIDGDDRPLPGSLWANRKFTPRLQQAVRDDPFGQMAQRYLVTGCTMAFRADLVPVALPVPEEAIQATPPIVHDRWLSLLLTALGPVEVLDEPLLAYRIHADQQIGLTATSAGLGIVQSAARKVFAPRDYTFDQRDQQIRLIEEVKRRARAQPTTTPATLHTIDSVLGYLQFRRDQPEQRIRRVGPIVRQTLLGTYHRRSRGVASAAVDLFRP